MADTPHVTPPSGRTAQSTPNRAEPTGWAGWVLFAAIMLVMTGGFQAIMGFVALFDDGYYLVAGTDLVVDVDYTAWGWVHLFLGVVAVAAGIGVIAGQTWARVVGIILAIVSALVNVTFLAAYPIWSVLVITLDVIAIYALAVHGHEITMD